MSLLCSFYSFNPNSNKFGERDKERSDVLFKRAFGYDFVCGLTYTIKMAVVC